MRKLIVLLVALLIFLGIWSGLQKYAPQLSFLQKTPGQISAPEKVKIVTEESVVIDTVKRVGGSVVTVAEQSSSLSQSPLDLGPFRIFGAPQDQGDQTPPPPQNIGSAFVVSSDGLIVTNKHVVSDVGGKYQIITNDEKKYDVQKIYRDPLNDIAIVKIDPAQNPGVALKPLELGDSSRLQVGQFVIAIGTALGEFRNTVTTGVISGLGRGIIAGSEFAGFAEQLDNVIQTDAAINPGNSGGPLLNSSGQVIGINTAVSARGQNIGFALPINVVKDSLKNFNETGQFNRPYLGIAYQMISRDVAIKSDLVEGVYVQTVVPGSAAEKAGVKKGDIITKVDGVKLEAQKNELATVISKHKVGDSITLTISRNDPSAGSGQGKTIEVKATLEQAPNQ